MISTKVLINRRERPLAYFEHLDGCELAQEGSRQRPMRPRRENKRRAFFLNTVDRREEKSTPMCIRCAGKSRGGHCHRPGRSRRPCPESDSLEETAATVSRTLREKAEAGQPPIRNLANYLFVAFMRRVRQVKGRQVLIEDSRDTDWEAHSLSTDLGETERRVLVDELLADCDETTRDIILGWMDGLSWKRSHQTSEPPATPPN